MKHRTQYRWACNGLIAFHFSFANTTVLDAATIKPYSDAVMGCTIQVSGTLIEGDAERFTQLAGEPTYDERRVCLDSKGGSFLEGIRLARAIMNAGFGTAIAEGSICESACAVAFMAGRRRSIEESPGRARILHPKGLLGFHAPGIVFEDRSFSREEIDKAYRIATLAVSQIVELSASFEYDFPDSLLTAMLGTDPSEMLYIESVGDAARWRIDVAPAAYNLRDDLGSVLENMCVHNFNLIPSLDKEYLTTNRPSGEVLKLGSAVEYTVQVEDFGLHIETNICTGDECGFSCSGAFFKDSSATEFFQNYTVPFSRPFMSYPSEMLIANVPIDFSASRSEFYNRLKGSETAEGTQCLPDSAVAQITKVKEFVNLRSHANFNAPVVRQVPVKELVRVLNTDKLTVIGPEEFRRSCIIACRAFGNNHEDRAARDRAQQCIDDHLLWYEVADAQNNRGWVSRKFLEEVE